MGELDAWRRCPLCAADLDKDDGRVECPACGFVHYANSKPTASAVIVDDEGRVLLSKRAVEPFAGMWDLPGGFLEEGEHPLDCLHRELREEAGVSLHQTEFLGVFMDRYGEGPDAGWTLNLYWTARIADGTPKPADDVDELRFFAPDEVPFGDLAFEKLPDVISAWRVRQQDS